MKHHAADYEQKYKELHCAVWQCPLDEYAEDHHVTVAEAEENASKAASHPWSWGEVQRVTEQAHGSGVQTGIVVGILAATALIGILSLVACV